MAIEKAIQNPTFGFDMIYHRIHEYCVHKTGVVVVNLHSYFNQTVADAGFQPASKSVVQIVGVPDVDVEAWIYAQLVLPQSEEIQTVPILDRSKYGWASGFTPQDRFYFEGGTVVP